MSTLMDAFVLSIISGLVVAVLIYIFRKIWIHSRKTAFVERLMPRDEYLRLVLEVSKDGRHGSIDLQSPRLKSRSINSKVAELQDAWEKSGATVRVLTTNNDESMRAALELETRGINVRVLPDARIDDDAVSYHIFSGPTGRRAILNEKRYDRKGNRQFVSNVNSRSVTLLLTTDFENLWESSLTLMDALVGRIIADAKSFDGKQLAQSLRELSSSSLALSPRLRDDLALRLGLLNSAQVIFVTGLSGAGKSTVRRSLEAQLANQKVPYASSSDYGDLYRSYLQDFLVDENGLFEPGTTGSFLVKDPKVLQASFLRSLSRLRSKVTNSGIVILEFARPDILEHLNHLDDSVTSHAHILYVEAPQELRSRRLHDRRQTPLVDLKTPAEVTVTIGDDHFVPDSAVSSYYGGDDIAKVEASAAWSGKVTRISGTLDRSSLEVELKTFVKGCVLDVAENKNGVPTR